MNGRKHVRDLNSKEKSDLYRRIRRYAKRYLERLRLIAENMEKITDKPEKQFEQIFYNEVTTECWNSILTAWHEGRRYAVEREKPKHYVDIFHDLTKERKE